MRCVFSAQTRMAALHRAGGLDTQVAGAVFMQHTHAHLQQARQACYSRAKHMTTCYIALMQHTCMRAGDHHAPQPVSQIAEAGGECKHGHDLAGNGDVDRCVALHASLGRRCTSRDAPQKAVIDVHHSPPCYRVWADVQPYKPGGMQWCARHMGRVCSGCAGLKACAQEGSLPGKLRRSGRTAGIGNLMSFHVLGWSSSSGLGLQANAAQCTPHCLV